MRRLLASRRVMGLDGSRAMSSGSIPPTLRKLSLAPRFADEDMKLLKSTAPNFRNFLRSIKEKKDGVGGESKDLVDPEVIAYSPALQSITTLSAAQSMLSSTISGGMPNAALHVLASMDHSLVLPNSISKDLLSLIMEKGSTKLMIELRQMLNRMPPPLILDEDDIGDCITYCMFKNLPEEAFSWYLVLEDCYHLKPTKSIVSILLPALAKSPSWERLFYVMDEASRLSIPVSARTRYQLLRECERKSKLRWRYASSCIRDLDLSADNLTSIDDDVTAGKCVSLVFNLLAREQKYPEILSLWSQLGREYRRAAVSEKSHVTQVVGVAAILLDNESVVRELVSLRDESLSLDSFISAAEGDNNSTDGSINNTQFPTVGLVWLYFRSTVSSLHRLRLEKALQSRGAEALAYLSTVATAPPHSSSTISSTAAASSSGPSSSSLQMPAGTLEAARLCAQCLDSLHEDGEEEHEQEEQRDQQKGQNQRVEVSRDVAAQLITLFFESGDDEALLLLLQLTDREALSTSAFVAASELLLRSGHQEEVLSLLEARLTSTTTATHHGGDGGGSPLRIFGPAIEALALEGDFELMVHLLLRHIPQPGAHRHRHGGSKTKTDSTGIGTKMPRWPSTQLFLKAMDALTAAGRPADAVELFKIAVTGPEALARARRHDDDAGSGGLLSVHSEHEDEGKSEGEESLTEKGRTVRPYPASLQQPWVSTVLVHAALKSCATGLLGQDALQILQLMDRSSSGFEVRVRHGVPVEEASGAASRQRNIEYVVTALAHPTYISALPAAVSYFRNSDRPSAMTRRLHLQCLASSLWAGSEEITGYFIEVQRHDEEEHRQLGEEDTRQLLQTALDMALHKFASIPAPTSVTASAAEGAMGHRERMEGLVARVMESSK